MKIAKNDGLIQRMLETIELRKDPKITMEACHALMTIIEQIKIKEGESEQILSEEQTKELMKTLALEIRTQSKLNLI